MSFAIAIGWVCVDGQPTRYARVVEEAARLRGQLAQMGAQARALRRTNTPTPTVPDPPDLAELKGEEELLHWVSWARSHLPELHQRLDQAARQALSAQLGAALPPRSRPTTTGAPPTPPPPETQEHQRSLRKVHQLLADNASEIDPAEAATITTLIDDLAALAHADIASVRAARHAVEVALAQAVARHRQRAHTEALREQMRLQAHHTHPSDRHALLRDLDSAPDPAALRPRLQQAWQRAETLRRRGEVAHAAAEALAEIGCEVSVHTPTHLLQEGEQVVALPERPGYALRLRLPTERSQLSTCLVRMAHTSPAEDEATQRWFCDHKQPLLSDTLARAAHPLRLREKLRLEPGERPLPVAHPPPASTIAEDLTDTEEIPTTRQRHH